MPTSYYGYVKRDATDYINWADIGKGMSDMLQNEAKIREEKKDAIDDEIRQFNNKLSEVPQGQDETARKAALEFADNASQYSLQLEKMLKSGRMKLKDYLVAKQNLVDGTNQSFETMTDWQKEYGDRMDRYRQGISSKWEVDNLAKVQGGFGDWNKSGFYINPINGQVQIAMKEEKIVDGKKVYAMSTNPNNIASIPYVKGLIQTKIDKFDAQGVTNDWAKSMGSYIKSDAAKSVAAGIFRQGQVVTLDDITKRKDFIQLADGEKRQIFDFYNAENAWINSTLANPYSRGSVLIDHVKFAPNGKQYRITNDEADAKANPEAIYEKIDPSTHQGEAQFSKEQQDIANQFVRDMVRPKYTYEEKVQTTSQLSDQYHPEKEEKRAKEKAQETSMNAWNQIFTARTPTAKRVAVDNLLGTERALSLGMTGIDVGDGTITISYENRDPRTIIFDKENINLGQWAELGTEVHGVDDTKQVMKRAGGGNPNALMDASQKDFTGVTAKRTAQDYGKVISQKANSSIDNTVVIKNDASKTADNLNQLFGDLGYTFTGDYHLGIGGKTDFIQISTGQVDKEGNPIMSEEITIDSADDLNTIKQKVINYMTSNVNKAKAKSTLGEIKAEGLKGELDE